MAKDFGYSCQQQGSPFNLNLKQFANCSNLFECYGKSNTEWLQKQLLHLANT